MRPGGWKERIAKRDACESCSCFLTPFSMAFRPWGLGSLAPAVAPRGAGSACRIRAGRCERRKAVVSDLRAQNGGQVLGHHPSFERRADGLLSSEKPSQGLVRIDLELSHVLCSADAAERVGSVAFAKAGGNGVSSLWIERLAVDPDLPPPLT